MPSVLVVDDSTTIRKMIMAVLRPLNLIFGEASSGLDAIEQLTLHDYDAVTLDLNMPDMHGLDFLRFVRNMTSMQKVPILVITTRNEADTQENVLQAGADAYITKPFTPKELIEAVENLLGHA